MNFEVGGENLRTGSAGAVALRLVGGRNVTSHNTPCRICSLRDVCLPCDLMPGAPVDAHAPMIADRDIRQGETLFQTGDALRFLYTVRSGFFKSVKTLGPGREQVIGFHMAGDMLGADAIGPLVHGCQAVALEDSRVCAILYARIEDLGDRAPRLQHRLSRVMSAQIVGEHRAMLLLGVMSAGERVAVFLLGLSQRLELLGYSRSEFILRMTRGEIGSFLGLQVETVSRTLSRMRDDGLISTDQKRIQILDHHGLKRCLRQGLDTGSGCRSP